MTLNFVKDFVEFFKDWKFSHRLTLTVIAVEIALLCQVAPWRFISSIIIVYLWSFICKLHCENEMLKNRVRHYEDLYWGKKTISEKGSNDE